jgi:hypothetical protein
MMQNLILNERFRILDETIAQQAVNYSSLNPHKNFATSFVEMGYLIAEKNYDPRVIKSLTYTLERIVHAQLVNFPDNIYWDFDFMVSSILSQALTAREGAFYFLNTFADKAVSLMNLFGVKTQIHFRYIHDFIYGFEWAKWVQKDPYARARIQPFGIIFLDYLLNRGQEMIQLINLNDAKYHQITGNAYRNPFSFSRQPECECRLLSYMAEEELIPVPAWDWNARPIWNQPFQQIRQELSVQLDIPNNPASVRQDSRDAIVSRRL